MPMENDVEHDWYSNETATLGDRLADARQAVGLSQKDLAQRLGVRNSTVEAWENDSAEPRAARLNILTGLLNVSLRWLMTGEGEGLAAPVSETELPDDIHELMHEIREVQRAMVQQADRLGHLQKRLRLALDTRR